MVKTNGIRRDDFDRRRNPLEELGIEAVERRNEDRIRALSCGEEFVASEPCAVDFTPDVVFAVDPCFYRLDEMRRDNQYGLLHKIRPEGLFVKKILPQHFLFGTLSGQTKQL